MRILAVCMMAIGSGGHKPQGPQESLDIPGSAKSATLTRRRIRRTREGADRTPAREGMNHAPIGRPGGGRRDRFSGGATGGRQCFGAGFGRATVSAARREVVRRLV